MTRFVHDPHLDLLDDARQAAAVADRSQRRLHGEAEAADASLRGRLLDLAEHNRDLVLETTVGHTVRGPVRSLAEDHVEVATTTGAAWVRLAAVTTVRAAGGVAAGGTRTAPADVALAAALRDVAERRAAVDVVVTGGATVRGIATSVGRDVMTIVDPATSQELLLHLAVAAIVRTTDRSRTP